jgi:uncharacterized protein YfeS
VLTDDTNPYGPLGSDIGFDVLSHYRDWRKKGNRPGQFLPQLLQTWEVGDYDWDDGDMRIILDEMRRSEKAVFERLTRDDVIIALAFAQIVVDGSVQPAIRDRAILATDRQRHRDMIEFRGWDDPKYRRKVLDRVRAFLAAVVPLG